MQSVRSYAQNSNRPFGSRAGQTMLIGTLSLVLFCCLLGFAVDMGWAYYRRHEAQAAADAAALAATSWAKTNGYTCGVSNVVCGTTYTCVGATPATNELEAGCMYAAQNGFSSGVTLTSNSTSSPVPGNSPVYWVKATITQSLPALFFSAGGFSALNVNVQSVAGINVTPPSSCIYVLDSSAAKALTMTGTTSVSAGCGVYVNSSAGNALSMVGSSTLNASTIKVVGGTSLGANTTVSPTPLTGQAATPDPLAGLSFPTVGSSCDYNNWSTSSSATLSPGIYCGGIRITGSGSITFGSGNYYLMGGGLSIAGSGSISGSGVTFFNTGKAGNSPGAIGMSGSGTLNLSASTSGTYQGILIYQDPSESYGSTNQISGSSSSTVSGTIYFPNTALKYTGSTSGQYTSIIADTVTFVGTSTLLSDTTGQYTHITSRVATLLQ